VIAFVAQQIVERASPPHSQDHAISHGGDWFPFVITKDTTLQDWAKRSFDGRALFGLLFGKLSERHSHWNARAHCHVRWARRSGWLDDSARLVVDRRRRVTRSGKYSTLLVHGTMWYAVDDQARRTRSKGN